MTLMQKTKPGLLNRLFNKDKPQPSSPVSGGEKAINEDGEILDTPEPRSNSNGIFASRRGSRVNTAVSGDIVDVVPTEVPAKATSTTAEAPAARPESSANFRAARALLDDVPEVRPAETLPKAPRADTSPQARTAKVAKDDAPPTEPAAVAPATPPKSRGLFGKKPIAATAAHAKVKKQAQKGPKSIGTSAKSIVLLTELGESGKQLLWQVGATSLAQIDATPVPVEVVSFSRDDIRFHTVAAMSYSKAQDMAIEEIGEIVAVVNRTKDLNALYCTREERATASPYRIAPGQQALDMLLKKAGREGQSLVTGFSLTDADSPSSVVVLYFVSQEGESTKPQVTVNPDNMEFVLSQFTSSRKINRKETDVVLFNNQDLLSVAGGIKAFADEKVWNGIPLRVLLNVGAGATGILAAGALGWAVTGFLQQHSLRAQTEKVQVSAKALTDTNNQIIESSLYSFSSQLSQDQVRMFSLAQQVWVPSSKVFVEMKGEETKITIALPLVNDAAFNNGPSVHAVTKPLEVQRLYDKEAPEGCLKSQPQTTGNLNEIRIDIVCQSIDSPFRRYRGD